MLAKTETWSPRARAKAQPLATPHLLAPPDEMQASWGAENEAPKPLRSGELYGEVGRWMVPNTSSVPDVFTRADPGCRGADDAKTKFKVKEYVVEGEIQKHTAKFAAEQDLQPIGLHAGFFAHPDRMTMVRLQQCCMCPASC